MDLHYERGCVDRAVERNLPPLGARLHFARSIRTRPDEDTAKVVIVRTEKHRPAVCLRCFFSGNRVHERGSLNFSPSRRLPHFSPVRCIDPVQATIISSHQQRRAVGLPVGNRT